MRLFSLNIPGQSGTGVPIDVPSGVPNPDVSLGDILTFGIRTMFVLAIILALFFLLWGGLSWILSGGDKEKLDKARKTLIFAIVGLIIVFLSFFILAFVATSVGFPEILPEWARFGNEPRVAGSCPDGSGNYRCGSAPNTNCATCSSDPNCNSGVYSIASCSGSSSCRVDDDCYGIPPSCPDGQVGTVVCNKQLFQQTGHCETSGCH